VRLIGREAEKDALHEVLDSVRRGMSGALVLRGEPGVGKSALLGYAVEHAGDLQLVRTVAVESEMALAFAAVHQLLSPLLPGTNRLPEPQRRALGMAFGLVNGPPANPFVVGLAALTLLADAAEERPVLCVVDDAHWLDDESADVLTFVARRLLADRVGMLFALRETAESDPRLQALPGLRIAGLPIQDACELLQRSVCRPVNAAVAERIVVETGGNPLAVVEAVRELAPEQLGGLEPLPEPLPVGKRLEDLFVRRVQGLPADTQRLVLLAAADQPGRGDRLWRAGAALAFRSPPRCRRRQPAWWSSGRRCGSSIRLFGRRSTTPRPQSSAGRLAGPWRRHAIRSSTQFRGPGIWPQPPAGPTKRPPPHWKRPRIEPVAVVDVPRRPCCGNARRC
jgi:hypothetical protein